MKLRIALKATESIWERDIVRYWRDKARFFSSLIQPLLFLAIFGVGMKSAFSVDLIQFDYVQFMFPGIIATTVLGISISTAVSIVTDRQFGFLKEILVSPIPRTSIAIGKILSGTTLGLIQTVLLLVLGIFIGFQLNFSLVLLTIGIVALLGFAITGLGVIIAARMKSTEGFQFIFQLLIFPMMFLSGAFFPLRDAPLWMDWISKINPLTYAVDGLRRVLLEGTVPAQVIDSVTIHSLSTNILVTVGFGILFVIVGVFLFRRAK
ncbi:ABC transporter permease [Patescibacteria group bacterium]